MLSGMLNCCRLRAFGVGHGDAVEGVRGFGVLGGAAGKFRPAGLRLNSAIEQFLECRTEEVQCDALTGGCCADFAYNAHVERLWRTIKYENVYLHSFDTVDQARVALRSYVDFYNQKRPHQALNYHTPNLIFALRVVPTRQQLFAQFKLQNQSNPLEVNMTPK